MSSLSPAISFQCRIKDKGQVCILPVFADGEMTNIVISANATIRVAKFCVCEYDILSCRYIFPSEYVNVFI